MNDLEQRLHGALTRAVPAYELAPGAIGTAVAAAVRIRRRRAAARGGIGVAAVIGAGALGLRNDGAPAPGPDRLNTTVSPSASPPDGQGSRVTLRMVDGGCPPTAVPGGGEACVRWVVEVRRDDGRVTEETLAWEGGAAGQPVRVPAQDPVLGVEIDGRRHTVTGRPAGDREWVFDLTVPAGARFSVVSLQTEDGSGMSCGSLRNLGDRCG